MITISKFKQVPFKSVAMSDFLGDEQGRRYADVPNKNPQLFAQIVRFFDDPAIHQRMVNSQVHHDSPPLAGVVADLEHEDWFDTFMRNTDAHETQRLRQAVGVLTKVVMLNYGFETTGKKGSLGRRAKVVPGTTTPAAYHNTDGLSLWFSRAERYRLPGHPHTPVAERAKQLP